MRIAPKPMPGQEVSLENLLSAKSPNPNGKGGPTIRSLEKSWIIEPVKTWHGPRRIELFEEIGTLGTPNRMKIGLPDKRLITADEFYGILDAIYDAQFVYSDVSPETQRLQNWIYTLWTIQPKALPFMTDTQVQFIDGSKAEVTHGPCTAYEKRIGFHYTQDAVGSWLSKPVFGAPSSVELGLVWHQKPLTKLEIKIGVPQENIIGTKMEVYAYKDSVLLVDTMNPIEGIPLFVRTQPYEVRK